MTPTTEERLEELQEVFAGIGLLVVLGIICVGFWIVLSWALTRSSVGFYQGLGKCFISIDGTDHEIGCAPTKNL